MQGNSLPDDRWLQLNLKLICTQIGHSVVSNSSYGAHNALHESQNNVERVMLV